MTRRNNLGISDDELEAIASIKVVRDCFGLEENEGGRHLDEVASIAVKRDHTPSMPGRCGDFFFLFDCMAELPLVVFKEKSGRFFYLPLSSDKQ